MKSDDGCVVAADAHLEASIFCSTFGTPNPIRSAR